ncbi:hypothetical protein [Gallionella capsiferriformans]|uniref:Uncharacterized protein n=1 Tax=Gallionella capsiferriformans (strain ES-2) TaxID=395494 RepID=D9SDF6_GALCS|nr:hypothetical protein [Gallionella capsiferriformans]ADL56754.1 hypothetical protein Galf_2759 [Gallionella capsiferriformans ES-2]
MSNRFEKAALVRGEARSADIERKVKEAMNTIMAEIKSNGGIYPANGGAVSKNEVARRAGISETTLFTPKQKELGKKVTLWLEALKKKETIGRQRVRRTFEDRAEDWKSRFLALQDSHIKTELDLQVAQSERDEAIAEVQRLRNENAVILDQLRLAGKSKITPIPKREN